jgi:hypothetical protein
MEFDNEIYKLLFAWTVAYAILEPIVAFVNYILSRTYGIKSIYEMHSKTSPFIVMASEFAYMTIVFIKTMWAYKYILKKPTYYPRKNNNKDYRDFIITYICVHVIIDILWYLTVRAISDRLPFIKFLEQYLEEFGIYSVARPLTYGLILVLLSDAIRNNLGDLEALWAVFFSLFMISVASF